MKNILLALLVGFLAMSAAARIKESFDIRHSAIDVSQKEKSIEVTPTPTFRFDMTPLPGAATFTGRMCIDPENYCYGSKPGILFTATPTPETPQ